MTHEYSDDECDQCMAYTQIRKDSDKWECSVCKLVEDIIYLSPINPLSGIGMNSHADTKPIFGVFAPGANNMELLVLYVGPLTNSAKNAMSLIMQNE